MVGPGQEVLAPALAVRARWRIGGVTLDQVLSSISNLIVLIWCAHSVSPADFGRFSLLSMVYALGLGVTHSLISIPVIAHPEDADSRPLVVLRSAFTVAAMVAVPCAVGGFALLAFDSPMAVPALVLAGAFPLLLLQDVGRYVAFARAQPSRAVVMDAGWLVLMMIAIAWSVGHESTSLTTIMLLWTGAGALSALCLFQYGVPVRGLSLTWLRERWSFSWRSLVGNLAGTGGGLVGAVGVALVSSPVAVAAVRASILLRRPGQVLQSAISTTVANEVARESPDRAGMKRHQRRAMGLASVAALLNLAFLIFLPDFVGRALLGGVWPLVDPLRLPIGLIVVALASQAGVRAVLLGVRQIRRIMAAEIVGMVITIPALVIGAALAGASGAMWGLVVGTMSISLTWWFVFFGYLRSTAHASGQMADQQPESP